MLRRIDERKQRRRKVMMGIFISALMVLSVFGIVVGGFNQSTAKYNGFKFERQPEGFYTVKIEKIVRSFWFYPTDLAAINYSAGTADTLRQGVVVPVAYSPNMQATTLQYADVLKLDLADIAKLPVVSAATAENPYNWPIIGCLNASQYQPIIFIEEKPQPSIQREGYCIFLGANGTDMLALHDRLIYSLTGVMDDS